MADTASGPEPADDVADPQDEIQRKFRQALERKRATERDAGGGLRGKNAGKVQGAHGPAHAKRSFRRRGDG